MPSLHCLGTIKALIYASSTLIILAPSHSTASQTEAEINAPMEVRYWDWGNTPKRDQYQYELLNLALELSEEKYGPYTLTRVRQNYTTQRVRREVNIGDTVNVRVGPLRSKAHTKDLADETNLRVDKPILANLLGYRQLIIHRDNVDKFDKTIDKYALQKMHAGLGRDWVDVQIFRTNGYSVNDASVLQKLINMLEKKRYDYLPLSILEAQNTINHYGKSAENFTIVSGILFHYPLPMIFYTSIDNPMLAKRIDYGLELADINGSAMILLNKYFASEISIIREPNTMIINLDNPFIPEDFRENKKLLPE